MAAMEVGTWDFDSEAYADRIKTPANGELFGSQTVMLSRVLTMET